MPILTGDFAERFWSCFSEKPWACSVNEVDWRAHGFEGSRLGYLLVAMGQFHDGHRAVDDCRALLEVLAFKPKGSLQTALGLLLDKARQRQLRIWAEHSPFELKDQLKKRGYRWSSGDDGRQRTWYIDVSRDQIDQELEYLRTEIYRRDVELPTQVMSALNRFSIRT